MGNRKYLLVGTDYFTKWVKAEALANIRDVNVQKFVWKNIVTRFRIPHTLISDNGLQFDSKAFRSYCSEFGITNRYSTLAYPQGLFGSSGRPDSLETSRLAGGSWPTRDYSEASESCVEGGESDLESSRISGS
nr:uncharacterized protein LOC112017312 [Quercus suber]